jgi:hypothetical protein
MHGVDGLDMDGVFFWVQVFRSYQWRMRWSLLCLRASLLGIVEDGGNCSRLLRVAGEGWKSVCFSVRSVTDYTTLLGSYTGLIGPSQTAASAALRLRHVSRSGEHEAANST